MTSAVGSRTFPKISLSNYSCDCQDPDGVEVSAVEGTKEEALPGHYSRHNTREPIASKHNGPPGQHMKIKSDTFTLPRVPQARHNTSLELLGGTSGNPGGRKGSSRYDILPAITAAAPRLKREFTFTGYDIMDDVDPTDANKKEGNHSPSKKKYESMCRKLGIVPVSQMERHLAAHEIKIKSRGLGPSGTKALAVTLVNNKNVTTLDISDNDTRSEGAKYIAEMLKSNHVITELIISDNLIGATGLKPLCRSLVKNKFIKKLDISGNGLKDKGAVYLSLLLQENRLLEEVKASHNEIGEEGGVFLGKAIAKNETLTNLDLSWNHLRGKGAVAIASGIKDNVGLRLLNLSWNGFGREGSVALGAAMTVNTTLAELDVRANRLHTDGLAGLMKGVQDNQGIVYLKLSNNPISPQGALLVIKAITQMQSYQLEELDLDDVEVTPEFVELLDALEQDGRHIKIKHGVVMQYTQDADGGDDDGGFAHMDPRALLFSLLEKDGLRVIDLFMRLDDDNSQSVERQEFKTGIIESGMPITEAQLDNLVDMLDADGDGEVDLGELLAAERQYKRSLLMKKAKEQNAK